MKECVRTVEREHRRRIPVRWQMQGHEDGDTRRRKVLEEIDAVHVHKVDSILVERLSNGAAVLLPCRGAHVFVDDTHRPRRRNESPLHRRAVRCHHDRVMPSFAQRVIERSEHLLRAAG